MQVAEGTSLVTRSTLGLMLQALFLTLHKVVEGHKMSQNTPTKIGIQTCCYFVSHCSGGSRIFKMGAPAPIGVPANFYPKTA